jgi:hypothetical protein
MPAAKAEGTRASLRPFPDPAMTVAGAVRRGAIEATNPLATSRMKTTPPQVGPRTRKAFVAPMFLLPASCRSTPRERPIQSPEGMEPSRNPRTTEIGSM